MIYFLVSDLHKNVINIIKILKKHGWKLNRIKGSHHVFIKKGSDRPVVVPVHGNIDLGKFADDILKKAGINLKGDAR